MEIIRHYIDFLDGLGFIEVHPPKEWKNTEIELSFTQDTRRLSTNAFEWLGDNAVLINEYITEGLTGGYGITEGLPYKAVLDCDGTFYDVVTACLNFADESAEYFCDIVKVPIRETGKIDFLTDRADSFRFELLSRLGSTEAGYISSADYIDTYYMVGKYPQKMEILMSSISVFIISKELFETVKRITDVAAAILGGLTGFIESLIQLLALTVYIVILIIALVELLNQLMDLIFPFVYYHKAMYIRTLLEKGCAYLGLNFYSSIFSVSTSRYYRQAIMPPKNYEGSKIGIPAPPSDFGYYDGTLGDLLRGLIEEFNGETKIIGNTLYFERKGSFITSSTFNIPAVKSIGVYGTNLSEVSTNYVVEYEYDGIDLYDYDAPNNRITQVICEPVTVNNKKNILLKGLTTRSIPFTLPNVKTTTTGLEIKMTKIFNTYANLASGIASLFGAPSMSVPAIPAGANISCLQLDTHFISQHKTYLALGVKVNPLTSTYLGTPTLIQNFHFNEILKPVYTSSEGNQWLKYKGTIPLCCEEYLQILGNNYGTYQGNTAKLTSVKWNPYTGMADIEFEVNQKYTNNLKAKQITPNSSTIYL